MHMPSHMHLLLGQYDRCVDRSIKAVELDSVYADQCLAPYLSGHNKATLVACSMLAGNFAVSVKYSMSVQQLNATYGAGVAKSMTSLFPVPQVGSMYVLCMYVLWCGMVWCYMCYSSHEYTHSLTNKLTN